MTFSADLATDIGKLRLELGDDISGSGVRPNASNLTDEALQVLIDREGSVMRAAAAACEMLARQWSTTADTSVGPRSEQLSAVATAWSDRAKELRAQYGGGSFAFAASFARDDGYAQANSETEYTP